jgi:hypothetical protein
MTITHIVLGTAVAVAAWSAAPRAQTAPAGTQAAPAPAAGTGLSDLDAMTFGCPKAALNAAAREAARAPSQGTYQFAYFNIISDSHHAAYEVHFKSNYQGEPDLKYCVAIYCQEGWDPKTTKASVMVMGPARQRAAAAAHGGECREKPVPVKRRVKR